MGVMSRAECARRADWFTYQVETQQNLTEDATLAVYAALAQAYAMMALDTKRPLDE